MTLSTLLSKALTLSGEHPRRYSEHDIKCAFELALGVKDSGGWTTGTSILNHLHSFEKVGEPSDAFARSALPLLAKICQEQEKALDDIANYARPDDRHDPLAYQNNFLGLSVCEKWAHEAQKTVAELIEGAGL